MEPTPDKNVPSPPDAVSTPSDRGASPPDGGSAPLDGGPGGRGGPGVPLGLFFLFLALLGLALFPGIPGFWALPLALSLIILPIKGPSALLKDFRGFFGPQNRGLTKSSLVLALTLAILLATGSATFLPTINLAAPKEAVLPEETLPLVAKLDGPVTFKARLGRESARGPVQHLMDLYQRASRHIMATVEQADGQSEKRNSEVTVVRPNTLLIEAQGFSETVSPISRFAIDRSLRRLLSPNRLVYNLMGDGEKSVLDQSPAGLSRWAASLIGDKIYLLDLAWPGDALPPEAPLAGALVLAGPRTPLGPEREKALMDYVIGGGKLLILQDPMVAGFDPAALSVFGLDMPLGLAVDPEAAWAGTQDRFIVGREFPAHPITLSLEQPVVWPLSGALTLADPAATPAPVDNRDIPVLTLANPTGGPAPVVDDDIPVLRLGQDPTNGSVLAEPAPSETAKPAVSATPASDDPPIRFHTWAVALSSEASWLETDLDSIATGDHRYQAGQDQNGPLVLSTATSVSGGGRLAIAADADLAANGFIGYGGNAAFLTNALFWLMGAEDDLPATERRGIALIINHRRAQLLFWIPSVFWPMLALIVWYVRYRSRRRER